MHVRQPTILYVESNSLLARFVGDVLELGNWHVWCAESGVLARTLLGSEEQFALMLVDNELRDTTGLEIVKYARSLRQRKTLPVVLFSIEDYDQEAKAAGASEFLRKPHDLFLLLDTIRNLLAGDGK